MSGVGRHLAVDPRRLLGVVWRAALISAVLSLAALMLMGLHSIPRFLFDYRGDLYHAAVAILHGRNPYRPGYLAHLAEVRRLTGAPTPAFAVPVYPAPVLLAAVPFALLPVWLGGALFIAISALGLVWGLRLLGVRDWRCIAVALLSWPCLFGLWFGTLSPLLVLGAGLVWQARDRVGRCAGALTALVVSKVFPWPLLVWPLITRRWRALAWALGLVLLSSLLAWVVIGWSSLTGYPHLLSTLSYIEQDQGVSLTTALFSLGVSPSVAQLLALAAGALLVVVAWRVGRQPDGARSAFGLLIMAALTAAPLVWVHYEVLLLVPIALMSPRLSALWFIPVFSALIPVPYFQAPVGMVMWPAFHAIVVMGLCRHPKRSLVLATPTPDLA